MKRKPKKLSLNRETLADLDRSEIRQVVGGNVSNVATCTQRPNVCDFSGRATCTTCQLTCTTNQC
jgi:natural product precursor